MKHVYTDVRFPRMKIIHDGSTEFNVYYNDKYLTSFSSWEKEDNKISEEFAQRRAQSYFNWIDYFYEPKSVEESMLDTLDYLAKKISEENDPVNKQRLEKAFLEVSTEFEISKAKDIVTKLL